MNGGTFTISGGAVSDNDAFSNGGGVYISSGGGTFDMDDGEVSGNDAASGGGVYMNGGTFTMDDGEVSGNSASSGGGGVYIWYGTFTMSGGEVSGNDASDGGGVYVDNSGTFTMRGGEVSGNILSGIGYGEEVLVDGNFNISGDARPERVFLHGSYNYLVITGPLSGDPLRIAIDLDCDSSGSLTSWEGRQILRLSSSYSSGNLASLKGYFTLGNATMTESPYTETPIQTGSGGYKIDDAGYFVTEE
jgi:hypothetical protein